MAAKSLFPKHMTSAEITAFPEGTVLYSPNVTINASNGECQVSIREMKILPNERPWHGKRLMVHFWSKSTNTWRPCTMSCSLCKTFDEAVSVTEAALEVIKANVAKMKI